ncbi:sialate O-acetylesterase [uncultured Algibacter sp.]|uniref:sialate O-acetylesterase n=1 Tax=uncultured Algibacter sp. TaxID=298659 RepID=UPI002633BA4F|nr:sialate O-acetylesterase [uncultured Algibacter sp.]
MKHLRLVYIVVCLVSFQLNSQVELPAFFGDNMVLQQKEIVSIWGKDIPNTLIKISSSWGEKKSTVVNSEGFWFSKIKTKRGSFESHSLKIEGSNTVTLSNVLIGEVWFCSGQSNMEMPLKGLRKSMVLNSEKYLKIAKNNSIRLFNNPRAASVLPNFDVGGKWVKSNEASAKDFSAIGYVFGTTLFENLNVPIGIIESSWGGTKIESWIPKHKLLKYNNIKFFDSLPIEENKQKKPTFLYNAMIYPFQDFKIKGILWYQGESNRMHPSAYKSYMKDLIASWRTQWKDKNLPFYFVQIAPFDYVKNKKAVDMGADLIREAQFKVFQKIRNTGLVITTDSGDCNDIHPSKKEIVAKRLANWALTKQYSVNNLNYRSGELNKMIVKNSKVKLHFKFQKSDFFLKSKNIKGFVVASFDKVFYPAQVSFSEDKKSLIIYSEQVKKPVAVRYGFEDCFESNLKTNSGLPISIFRTDNW